MSLAVTRAAPIDPLEIGVRRIRRVGLPDVPFSATRAVMGDEDAVLLVDAADLDDWPGWRASGAQHLLGPTDVLRGGDGHEAILNDLRESCDRTFGVRDEAGATWVRGEVVTCVVSMLRGLSEAAERGLDDEDLSGAWWITADGRPVFAFACGNAVGQSISAATDDALRRIQVACDDRVITRIIDDALDALESPGALGQRSEEIETALFEAAAPQPIAVSAAHRAAARPARSIEIGHDTEGTLVDRLRMVVERHIDSGVGEATSGVLRSFSAWRSRRGERGESKHHGRVALIGAGAAAVVIAAGMLWPSGEGSRAETPAETISPPTTASPSAAPTLVPGEALDDPLKAASVILSEWAACEVDCDQRPGIEWSGAIAAPDHSIALVDDYGEVVLFKVAAEGAISQLMVLERVDERWRIRDVFEAP